MRLPRYLLILFTYLLGIQSTFAQQLMPGYYIDPAGERKEASYKFNFDGENYEKFVIVSDGEELDLRPDQALEVGFENGRVFQSIILPDATQKAFVLVMVDGEVDLLKWEGNYFLRRSDQITPLQEVRSSRTVDGEQVNSTIKQYQGVLLSVMQPTSAQQELGKAIRTSDLNDRDLIKIFQLYHEQNNLALGQEVGVIQGPVFKIKWKVQAGVGVQKLLENFENQGFEYGFESGISPYLEVGARFRDFRSSPRLMVDLGIGYYAESDEILAKTSQISFELEGKQSFTSSSIVLPMQIHYIFSKGASAEWYAGAGLTFWITNYKNDSAELVLDNGEPDLITHTDDFVLRKSASLSPNLKLGWSMNLSEKSHFFIEAKGDFLIKNYEMIPLVYYSNHNLLVGTFSAGIAF